MTDFPRSLIEFQQRFPDEAACVKYLFMARWPEGFVCPDCGKSKAWPVEADSAAPREVGIPMLLYVAAILANAVFFGMAALAISQVSGRGHAACGFTTV